MYIITGDRTGRTASIIQHETQFNEMTAAPSKARSTYKKERRAFETGREYPSTHFWNKQNWKQPAWMRSWWHVHIFCEFMVVIMLVLTYKAFSLSRSPVWWYISL